MPATESDDSCPLVEPGWSEPEKWVWQEVQAGRIANFNDRYGKIDPRSPDGWSAIREITPFFLETILTRDVYQKALPRQGVRIVGAWVRQPIDLAHGSLSHPWWLDASRMEKDADLSYLSTTSSISLEDSAFIGGLRLQSARIDVQLNLSGAKCTGLLNMNSLETKGHLFMGKGSQAGAEFAEVDLRGAKVGGTLDMTGAKCTGKLSMGSLETTGHLFMRSGAEFAEVDLRSAKVGVQLDMSGAKCTGLLNMNSLETKKHLFMGRGAEFAEVDLRSAKVGGVLDMGGQSGIVGARCTGKLNMGAVEVSGSVYMRRGAVFESEVSFVFAQIGGRFDISGAQFAFLDMTETCVRGEFRLGSRTEAKPTWPSESRLVLRNTAVSTVQTAGLDAFPKDLDLAGFTYSRLEGLGITGDEPQNINWKSTFVTLLQRDRNYSPQLYQNLAGVLHTMGHPDKANTILYEGKEHERREMKARGHRAKWCGLSLLKWTIGYGYGYRYFFSLVWLAVFIALGAWVVSTTTPGNTWGTIKTLGFSFDMLIPLVKLDESHFRVFSQEMTGWQYYYFFLHKLVGYVLASFVLAGLSGITKK